MKREKQLTKRERKALKGPGPEAHHHHEEHIHCLACGRHLDPVEFTESPPRATRVRCRHGSVFPTCAVCKDMSQRLLDIHDRTGQPVQKAQAWH